MSAVMELLTGDGSMGECEKIEELIRMGEEIRAEHIDEACRRRGYPSLVLTLTPRSKEAELYALATCVLYGRYESAVALMQNRGVEPSTRAGDGQFVALMRVGRELTVNKLMMFQMLLAESRSGESKAWAEELDQLPPFKSRVRSAVRGRPQQ